MKKWLKSEKVSKEWTSIWTIRTGTGERTGTRRFGKGHEAYDLGIRWKIGSVGVVA